MINVDVPAEGLTEAASKLLAAAEELGLAADVVKTTTDGLFGYGFIVPDEVAEKAGLAPEAPESEPGPVDPEQPVDPESEPEPKPVKRGPGRPRKATASNEE